MRAAGIEQVRVLPTGGHPVVYGDWLHAPGRPTVLIYGHFDVQPADPIEAWTHPPFEPLVENDRVFARGASDDKGNMLAPILAVEALLETAGRLPLNLKFLFEGQEEIGSPQLSNFMAAHRELLACDLVLSADKSDLHSGMHGGAVQNPIHALVRLLDSMRSPEGEILVEGFYDDVTPLTEAERARIAEIPMDDEAYAARLGIDSPFGEPGYSTLERQWARPTLEVNGIWGGFQEEGTKTVIPSTAHAKITCRLVANQDPRKVVELLAAHLEANAPPGVVASLSSSDFAARPYRIRDDHPGNREAHAVLEEMYGKPPYYVRMGGSIPVCGIFLEVLGACTVVFGFGLNDERFHAPNEFFRLESFARGQRAYGKLLQRLAESA
jgi:acetylornithine deacetylase/succinyl-diaminopimelate desuccinylase-like protein